MSVFFQRIHVHVPSSLARQPPPPPPHVAVQIEALRVPQPPAQAQAQAQLQRKRPLPKQLSCTESGSDFDGAAAAYARYFSRQNTSEDSANVTVSTVLAQSDSQSLHALPSYANTPTASAGRDSLPERLKSRSTSLLPIRRTPEAVIIPMEGEVGYEQPLPAQLAEKLQRMTSTSTGSSVAPTGCCSATKSMTSKKPFQSFKPTLTMAAATAAQSTGSDDEYRRRKRKYSKN